MFVIPVTFFPAGTPLELNIDIELADLQGNKQLEEQYRITAVAQAESNVATARDTLAEVEDTVDQTLELQDRLAALEAAEAALAQTVRDLGEELDGPNQAELVVREKALKVAQEKLGDLVWAGLV